MDLQALNRTCLRFLPCCGKDGSREGIHTCENPWNTGENSRFRDPLARTKPCSCSSTQVLLGGSLVWQGNRNKFTLFISFSRHPWLTQRPKQALSNHYLIILLIIIHELASAVEHIWPHPSLATQAEDTFHLSRFWKPDRHLKQR